MSYLGFLGLLTSTQRPFLHDLVSGLGQSISTTGRRWLRLGRTSTHHFHGEWRRILL